MGVCVGVCLCMGVCVGVCAHVCMCVHVYTVLRFHMLPAFMVAHSKSVEQSVVQCSITKCRKHNNTVT